MPITVKPIETIEEYQDAQKRLATVKGEEREVLIADVEKWEPTTAQSPRRSSLSSAKLGRSTSPLMEPTAPPHLGRLGVGDGAGLLSGWIASPRMYRPRQRESREIPGSPGPVKS